MLHIHLAASSDSIGLDLLAGTQPLIICPRLPLEQSQDDGESPDQASLAH